MTRTATTSMQLALLVLLAGGAAAQDGLEGFEPGAKTEHLVGTVEFDAERLSLRCGERLLSVNDPAGLLESLASLVDQPSARRLGSLEVRVSGSVRRSPGPGRARETVLADRVLAHGQVRGTTWQHEGRSIIESRGQQAVVAPGPAADDLALARPGRAVVEGDVEVTREGATVAAAQLIEPRPVVDLPCRVRILRKYQVVAIDERDATHEQLRLDPDGVLTPFLTEHEANGVLLLSGVPVRDRLVVRSVAGKARSDGALRPAVPDLILWPNGLGPQAWLACLKAQKTGPYAGVTPAQARVPAGARLDVLAPWNSDYLLVRHAGVTGLFPISDVRVGNTVSFTFVLEREER